MGALERSYITRWRNIFRVLGYIASVIGYGVLIAIVFSGLIYYPWKVLHVVQPFVQGRLGGIESLRAIDFAPVIAWTVFFLFLGMTFRYEWFRVRRKSFLILVLCSLSVFSPLFSWASSLEFLSHQRVETDVSCHITGVEGGAKYQKDVSRRHVVLDVYCNGLPATDDEAEGVVFDLMRDPTLAVRCDVFAATNAHCRAGDGERFLTASQ